MMILLFMVRLVCCQISLSLTSWQFQISGSHQILSAKIPSTLAIDLRKHKLLPSDPYFRDNILDYYNYEMKQANYTTSFELRKWEIDGYKRIKLIFEGLDTHCRVFLNGQNILTGSNMFTAYEVDISKIVSTHNQLRVSFSSSAAYDLEAQKNFQANYEFSLPANFSFTRKAAYQYGWDWGPRILTVGIWKNVLLRLYNEPTIGMVRLYHDEITRLTKDIKLTCEVQLVELNPNDKYELKVHAIGPNQQQLMKETQVVQGKEQGKFNLTSHVLDVSPILWWTWDIGTPNLVTIKVILQKSTGILPIRTKQIKTGIRSVRVKQEDSQGGKSFTFVINGQEIFARGGNYIPPEMSMPEVTQQLYNRIRKDAQFGRFNMIRLWGGGQFQNDQFYEEMDEAGILIWHDLMFACALYPLNDDLAANIAKQMRENLKRIQHHPSIGLWNGNNEVWIGWREWGWQQGLTDQQKKIVESMYFKIFKEILPESIQAYASSIDYWQTSPSSSSNSQIELAFGDIHFWGVWGAALPIQEYQNYIGRFNSEYGMQAMPDISTIESFTQESDRYLWSQVLRLHERHIKGMQYLQNYTTSYSGKTSNLTRFVYFSQVMQSYALEKAITSLRGHKGFCMGSIYWQLNDLWPVVSWSTVDYKGIYKAAHYSVQRLYSLVKAGISRNTTTNTLSLFTVNDGPENIEGTLQVLLMDFKGQIKKKQQYKVTLKSFEIAILDNYQQSEFIEYLATHFLLISLRKEEFLLSQTPYYFVPMSQRKVIKPELTYQLKGAVLQLKTVNLATSVWIRFYNSTKEKHFGINLDENYFDMMPGAYKQLNLPKEVLGLQLRLSCYEYEILSESNKAAAQ